MRLAKWAGWVRDENGKTEQVQSRAETEAREKKYKLNEKYVKELGKVYSALNESEKIAVQEVLAKKIDLTNRFAVSKFNTIAGVDLAYSKNRNGNVFAICCIDVMDIRTKEILNTSIGVGLTPVPYSPYFLSFREVPAILSAYNSLWCKPDLLMIDGNGYLHYRHMGLATHAAIELNTPAIGVAKNYLKINDIDYKMPKNEVGAYTDIIIRGEVYGRALRTRRDVKPIFVSCGNWIDLDTATEITLSMVTPESRQPLPTRTSNIKLRSLRRRFILEEGWNLAQ